MSKSYGVVGRMASQSSAERHVERIRLLGYSVVEGGLALSVLAALPAQIDALLERQAHEAGGRERLRDVGDQGTARCCLAYDDAFVPIATDPAVLAICQLLLGDYFVLMQQNAVINAPEQAHTQHVYHRDLPYQHFTSSRPLAIGALFCADSFTTENGATIVIPASHKVEAFPSGPSIDEVEQVVEAPAGSVHRVRRDDVPPCRHESLGSTATSGESRLHAAVHRPADLDPRHARGALLRRSGDGTPVRIRHRTGDIGGTMAGSTQVASSRQVRLTDAR